MDVDADADCERGNGTVILALSIPKVLARSKISTLILGASGELGMLAERR